MTAGIEQAVHDNASSGLLCPAEGQDGIGPIGVHRRAIAIFVEQRPAAKAGAQTDHVLVAGVESFGFDRNSVVLVTAEQRPWCTFEPIRGLGCKTDRIEIGKIEANPVEGNFAVESQVRLHEIARNTANAPLGRNIEIQIDLAVVGLPIERQIAEIDLRLGPDRIVVCSRNRAAPASASTSPARSPGCMTARSGFCTVHGAARACAWNFPRESDAPAGGVSNSRFRTAVQGRLPDTGPS
ncbi:hypothetical protein ACWGTI_16010 [Mesorhizobium sp. ArgA1]